MSDATAVIVLGMHRCGTSVLTKCLETIGVFLGRHLMEGKADNPKGFFEDVELASINLELLSAMGCYWNSLILKAWQEISDKDLLIDKAAGVIRDRFSDQQLWGFKDPRVTRLMSFWDVVFIKRQCRIVFVVANRHPLSVANSLAVRDGMSIGHSLLLWLQHQSESLRIVLARGGLIVSYDRLMERPQEESLRLANFLGISAEQIDSLRLKEFECEFVDSALRHTCHSALGDDLMFDSLSKTCCELYLCLESLAALEFINDDKKNKAVSVLKKVDDWLTDISSIVYALDVGLVKEHNIRRERDEAAAHWLRVQNELYSWRERLWEDQKMWRMRAEKAEGNLVELHQRLHDLQSKLFHSTLKSYDNNA